MIETRPVADCELDIVALGEVMLRLDPGEGRIRTARTFEAWEGGGEYNVARALRKVFGLRAGVVTALADNEIGHLVENLIMQGGVDTSLLRWEKDDGIGRTVRNGLNFTERGFGVRGAVGVSDRANTAIAHLAPGTVDWDDLFGRRGVRWLHTGGIYAALSEHAAAVAEEAMAAAQRHGTVVSFDLNYRPSLWSGIGGSERARDVNTRLASHVDVMIGNEEDFTAALGFEVEHVDEHLRTLPMASFAAMVATVAEKMPWLSVVATTLRTVHSASDNDWQAHRLVAGDRGALLGGPRPPGHPRPRRWRRRLRVRARLRPARGRGPAVQPRARRRPRCVGDDHAGGHLDGDPRRGARARRRRQRARASLTVVKSSALVDESGDDAGAALVLAREDAAVGHVVGRDLGVDDADVLAARAEDRDRVVGDRLGEGPPLVQGPPREELDRDVGHGTPSMATDVTPVHRHEPG